MSDQATPAAGAVPDLGTAVSQASASPGTEQVIPLDQFLSLRSQMNDLKASNERYEAEKVEAERAKLSEQERLTADNAALRTQYEQLTTKSALAAVTGNAKLALAQAGFEAPELAVRLLDLSHDTAIEKVTELVEGLKTQVPGLLRQEGTPPPASIGGRPPGAPAGAPAAAPARGTGSSGDETLDYYRTAGLNLGV